MTSVNPGPSSSTSINTSAQMMLLPTSSRSAEFFGASPTASGDVNVAAINFALAMGGLITLNTPGTYILNKSTTGTRVSGLTYDICLVIPSNTLFRVGPGVILQAAAGLNNVALIQNSSLASGNTNIALEGGLYDGNSANTTRTDGASDFACIAMWLQNITGLTLKSVSLINPRAWGIGIGACNHVRCTDTNFFYTCPVTSNQGGYQFQGANTDIIVRNTMGNTYDDLVAFVTEFPPLTYMAGPGPVTDLLIDGVISDVTAGCLHLVRLQDTAANPITNPIVRNLLGPYTDAAVVIGPPGGTTPFNGAVIIDGVNCSPLAGTTPPFPTIYCRNGASSLTINNVNRTYSDGSETVKQAVVGLATSGTILHCKITNVNVLDNTAAGAGIGFITVGAGGTVGALQISNIGGQTTKTGGSNSLITVQTSAQIGRLTVNGIEAIRISNLLNCLGTIGQGAWFSDVYSLNNQAAAFVQNKAAAFPILGLSNVRLDGTQGGAAGCISVTGVTGTMLIQMSNCSFNNGANVNLVRAGAEAIRVQSFDTPVPSGILTQAVGDMFLDSSNSNNPYRCSVAPSTFVAL